MIFRVNKVNDLKQSSLWIYLAVLIIAGFLTAMYVSNFYNINNSKIYVIKIDQDNLFNPSYIRINKNDSVTFINRSNTDHWPASNIHPSHEIYPEFDPKKPIEPGNSWVMVFSRSGSWRYHDHLHPTSGGTVVVNDVVGTSNFITDLTKKVLEKSEIVKGWIGSNLMKIYFKIFPSQKNVYLSQQEIKQIIDKNQMSKLILLLDVYGDEKVMEMLQIQSNAGLKYNCHQPAHQVGRIAYKIEGERALSKNITICNSGFYHGVMAGFVYGLSNNGIINKINDKCNQNNSDFAKSTCYHGAGHGLMAYYDYNLPQAINGCKTLKAESGQENCLVGVFMENIAAQFGDSLNPHQTNWLNNDMKYPCNQVDQSKMVQKACYAMQPLWISYKYHYNYKKVIDVCLQVNQNDISNCLFGLGEVMGFRTNFNSETIQKNCDLIPDKTTPYRQACFKGAISMLMDYWGPHLDDRGEKFCHKLPSPNNDLCINYINERINIYH